MSDNDDRRPVSAATVRSLIEAQFPHWADLPVEPVDNDGWDNHSFRLGDDMKARLPSASRYASQVEKESQWLPRLAPHLPLPIPKALGVGKPGEDYPWPWSIQSWLPGHPAELDGIDDVEQFACDLARFLLALQAAPAQTGPPPGPHNFFRGGPLRTYDSKTRDCLDQLHDDTRCRRRAGRLGIGTRYPVGASPGLGQRRRGGRQPPDRQWPALGCDRFRMLWRRRSRL